jgi:hypothetical protein
MAGWAAIFIVLIATLLGIIATLVAKKDPGSLLGALILIGTVVAGFGVQYSSAYLLIPVPALAYVVAAMATGYVHDHSIATGSLALGVHAAEWVGAGFLWMFAGTVAAIVIAAGRWGWERRDLWLNRGRPGPGGPGPGGFPGSGPAPDGYPGRSRETAVGYAGPARPGTGQPGYARPPAGYPDAPAGRAEPSGRPEPAAPTPGFTPNPGPRPTTVQPAPGPGDQDPFRRYYDEGDTRR